MYGWLGKKKDSYSHLNMEDITDAGFADAKRVYKDFEVKHLKISWFLCSKWYIWDVSDVFENVRNICLKIYKLDHEKFLSAPGLAWQVALKSKVKLDLLSDIDILLMVEKCIRRGICHSIYQYAIE